MAQISAQNAAETVLSSAVALCQELIIKRMKNENDRRGMEFVLKMLESACNLIIESAGKGRMPSKMFLVKELNNRTIEFVKLMGGNEIAMVACIINVTELAILTAGSAQNTVLAAEVSSSAVLATAAVPMLSAVIAIGGTLLTTSTVCAAAYELVQAVIITTDSCKAAIAANPRAKSIIAAYSPIEGSYLHLAVVA